MRGVTWRPDGKKISFLDSNGQGNTELWELDAATGERSLLVSGEKMREILSMPSGKESQATGAGRHAPSQYQWAPGGDALLFAGPRSLTWFELASQTGRVLASGEEQISDVKISPNGRYVSFVRGHNLWLAGTADGAECASGRS